MADFLGNINWDKMTDLFGHAAAMYTPGGVAEWQRGKDARANNELLRRIQEQQLSQAKTLEEERAERQSALGRIVSPPGLHEEPVKFDMLNMTAQDYDSELDKAQQRYKANRRADIGTAFPEVLAQSYMNQVTPKYTNMGGTMVRQVGDEITPMYTAPPSPDQLSRIALAESNAASLNASREATERMQEAQVDRYARIDAITAERQELEIAKEERDAAKDARKRSRDMAADKAAVRNTLWDVSDASKVIDRLLYEPVDPDNPGAMRVDNPDLHRVTGPIDKYTWSIRPGVRRVEADLKTLLSKMTLNVMGTLKMTSATGSTGFGALSQKELEVLQDALANIKAEDQTDEGMRQSLMDIQQIFDRMRTSRLRLYRDTYGEDYVDDIDEGSEQRQPPVPFSALPTGP